MLGALKISLVQLEEKTKLELQLLQSDPKFWQVALRDKLLRVSQLFSSQATDQIHFNDAESCWAYLGTYTAAHATLVQATVTSGQFEPLTEFIKRRNSKERLVHWQCSDLIHWQGSTSSHLLVPTLLNHYIYMYKSVTWLECGPQENCSWACNYDMIIIIMTMFCGMVCRLYVCCLGAGPGSEILGLHQLLPSNTEWMLLDNCEQWNHTAQVLLHDICGVPFRYGAVDICRGRSQSRKRDTELTPNFAFKRVSAAFLFQQTRLPIKHWFISVACNTFHYDHTM